MGAGNVLALECAPADGMRIEAGAHNDAVLRVRDPAGWPGHRPFRSEASSPGPGRVLAPDCFCCGLHSAGLYPGGFYRYAVAVGQNQFMADDARRSGVGENVGIGLPVSSLHIFFEEWTHETQLRITRGGRRY